MSNRIVNGVNGDIANRLSGLFAKADKRNEANAKPPAPVEYSRTVQQLIADRLTTKMGIDPVSVPVPAKASLSPNERIETDGKGDSVIVDMTQPTKAYASAPMSKILLDRTISTQTNGWPVCGSTDALFNIQKRVLANFGKHKL